MAEPRYCSNCGTPIAPRGRFCPNCGLEAVAPPVVPPPAEPRVAAPPPAPVARPSKGTYLIWVPIAVIGLGLLAWAVLGGLPFGREPRQPERPVMDVVNEREVTTGTVAQIGDPDANADADDDAAPPPPVTRRPVPPRTTPPRTAPPKPSAAPPPVRASSPAPAAGEVSEAEARQSLERYVVSRRDYGVSASCVSIASLGYRNAGYTFDVRDRCSGNSLGRWRVDAEDPSGVFRQRADGRFLRP